MLCYKNSTRFILTLIALAFGLSSCLRSASDDPKPNQVETGTNGDFRILEVTGTPVADQTSEIWTFPTEKTYDFRVCLESRTTRAPVPFGQTFEIKRPDGSIILTEVKKADGTIVSAPTKTDNIGCVNWVETIPFNFVADSIYIERKRTIVGRGSFKGSDNIRLAINPWLQYRKDVGEEVIDLNRSKLPESYIMSDSASEIALRGSASRGGKSLFIDSAPNLSIVQTREVKNGKMLKVVIRVNPYINLLNLNRNPDPYYFKQGEFMFRPSIVANYVGPNGKYKLVLLPDLPSKPVKIGENGILVYQAEVPLKKQVPTGQIQLALSIEPMNLPSTMGGRNAINAYQGLHTIGNFSELFGNKTVDATEGVMAGTNFNYGNFIEEAKNFDEVKNSKWVKKLPPVYYDNMEPRFVRIKSGETATKRTVIYRVSTIVKDSVTGNPRAFEPIQITPLDGQNRAPQKCHYDPNNPNATSNDPANQYENHYCKTNHNGLLIWWSEITHLYYQPEQYRFESFNLNHEASTNDTKVTLAINPWDEGWTFGTDLRGSERKFKEMDEYPVESPKLMVDAFRYQTIRFRYVIDEYMTLNVKKAVVMALDPLVQRRSIQKGRVFEPLRDGIYLAKIALVKFYLDPFENGTKLWRDPKTGEHGITQVKDSKEARKGEYTTVIKKLLRVQAGRITTPLEFSMRDLRMMSIRSNIMVQLETIDEEKLMRTNLVEEEIRNLISEYNEFQEVRGSMTDEEENRFFEKKVAEIREGHQKFREQMSDDMAELNRQREEIQQLRSTERFNILDKLDQAVSEGQAENVVQSYREMLNLPEPEFMAIVQDARNNLEAMEEQMQNYWFRGEKLPSIESLFKDEEDETNSQNLGIVGLPEGATLAESEEPAFAGEKNDDGTPKDNPGKPFILKGGEDFINERTVHKLDYLASMNVFFEDYGLPSTITNESVERYQRNNYTQNPAAPFVDLNTYTNDSGLKKRAFIGPCTLVENDNMSELRPTDTIDEKYCDRIDCGEILYFPKNPPADNSEFEESPYHDSLKRFAGTTVDDFIPMHEELELHYEKSMFALAQLGRYVKTFNLDYTSLEGKPLLDFKDGCKFEAPGRVWDGECTELSKIKTTSPRALISRFQDADIENLIQRYFYINPYSKLEKYEEEVVREDSLQPLFDKIISTTKTLTEKIGKWAKPRYIPYTPDSELYTNPHRNINHIYYVRDRRNFIKNHLDGKIPEFKTNNIRNWLSNGIDEVGFVDSLRICDVLALQTVEKLRTTKSGKTLLNKKEAQKPLRGTKAYYSLLERCFEGLTYLPHQDKIFFQSFAMQRRYRIAKTGKYEHKAGKNMNINVGIDFGVGTYHDVGDAASASLNLITLVGTGIGIAGAIFGAPFVAVVGLAGAILGGGGLSGQVSESKGSNISISTSVNKATFLVVQKAEMDIEILEHEKCLTLQFTEDFIDNATIHYRDLGLADDVYEKNLELRDALTRGKMICEGIPDTTPQMVREDYFYVTQHFTAGDMLDDVNLLNHVWLLSLRGKNDFNKFISMLKAKPINKDGEVIDDKDIYDYSLYRLGKVYSDIIPTFPGIYTSPD